MSTDIKDNPVLVANLAALDAIHLNTQTAIWAQGQLARIASSMEDLGIMPQTVEALLHIGDQVVQSAEQVRVKDIHRTKAEMAASEKAIGETLLALLDNTKKGKKS